MTDQVLTFIENNIGRIRLNRPKAIHALTPGMCDAINTALLAWRTDDSVTAVMIDHTEGRGFCAGGDITSMRDRKPGIEDARERMRQTGETVLALLSLEKPLIAAVDGPAYGAGFGLAAAADFVVATPRARLRCGRLTAPRWTSLTVRLPRAGTTTMSASTCTTRCGWDWAVWDANRRGGRGPPSSRRTAKPASPSEPNDFWKNRWHRCGVRSDRTGVVYTRADTRADQVLPEEPRGVFPGAKVTANVTADTTASSGILRRDGAAKRRSPTRSAKPRTRKRLPPRRRRGVTTP